MCMKMLSCSDASLEIDSLIKHPDHVKTPSKASHHNITFPRKALSRDFS